MPDFRWPDGYTHAISLAFDGVVTEDLPVIVEELKKRRISATFFTCPAEVLRGVSAWQSLILDGHEIGNGCLKGVTDNGDVPNWTLRAVEQELFMAHSFFEDIFAEQETTTFLYPGIGHACAEGSYRPAVEETFPYAVTGLGGSNDSRSNLAAILTGELEEGAKSGWTVVRVETLPDLDLIDATYAWVAPVGAVAKYIEEAR